MKRAEYETRLYRIFYSMHNRCYNPKNTAYHRYGAVGITVCPEWFDYLAFKTWAESSGYAENLTIDRIDGAPIYSPDTCRWATYQTQSRNKGKRKGGTSKFIGVSWYPRNKKWSASIFVDKKNQYLGLFVSEEDAARARDNYIVENALFGFQLNFP